VNNRLNIAVKYELEGDPFSEIPTIIEKETLDQHYYSTVNIFSKINKFTFVPTDEYNYGEETAFIRNSFGESKDQIGLDLSAKEHLTIVHAYDQSFQLAFSELSNNQNFRHLSLAYIEGISEDGVHISVYKHSIVILVRQDGMFRFYNQFNAVSTEDRMYFVMLSFDQLDLDPAMTAIYLNGENEYVSDLQALLAPYVANFRPNMSSFDNVELSEDLQDLYLASICE
jgi:hypothetical protein